MENDSEKRIALSDSLSDGAQTSYTYDANGWVTTLSQKSANGTVLSNITYTRDRLGNILSQTESAANTTGANTGTTTYTYDALYRLKTADYPALVTGGVTGSATVNDEAFSYDAVGNRLTQTKGGLSVGAAGSSTRYYEYVPNSNRLAAIHTGSLTGTVEKSYTYDDAGRLTQQTGTGAKTLSWNQQDHAKTINANSKTISYGYDPLSYRIASTGSSRGSQDYYLEGEHLEALYSNNLLQAQYLRGASTDELLAGWLQDTSNPANIPANANTGVSVNTITGTPYIFHHDTQNSVSSISSHDGNMLQQASYSAFGNSLNQTGSAANNSNTNTLKYTGREQDADTGLYYCRARYYDTDIGRFISEDPKGFAAGVNFYAYVNNNPVNANDPSGMCPSCIGALYGAVSGGVGGYVTAKFANQGRIDTLKSIGLGIVAGAGVGALNPIASNSAGAAAAAAGLARSVGTVSASAVIGGTTSAVGQFAGNVVAKQPLGTNFSYGAVAGSAVGNTFGIIPAKLSGNLAGSIAGTSVPFGSRSLTIMTPAVQRAIGTTRAVTEGLIGGIFETGGQAIQSTYFPNIPSINYGGLMANNPSMSFQQLSSPQFAAGGYLLYPNKPNNNQMQSVYSK